MSVPIWVEKEGRWVYRVTIDGITKKFTSTKKGVAGRRVVLERAKKYELGMNAELRSVSDEWARFIADVRSRSSACNVDNVEQVARLYFPKDFMRRNLRSLHLTDFQRVINSATKQDGSPLSRKSLGNIKNALSSFINFSRLDGATDIVPTGLYIPKNGLDKKEKTILQPDEIRAIFEGFNDEFYINLWRLMLVTGMRPSEALGLQWDDIKEGRLIIRRAVNRDRELTSGKNKNALRMVPISSILKKVLDDQRQKTAHLGSVWVFPSPSGDMPSQSTAFNSMSRISKKLGTSVSPYGLRHTFISFTMQNDVPEAIVKAIVGHSVSMDTYSTYGYHETKGSLERGAAEIDYLLRKMNVM